MTRTLTMKEKLFHRNAPESARRIIHWVSEVYYEPGTDTISIIWHDDLIPFLNDLGRVNPYIKYSLDSSRQLKSTSAIRMFRWAMARRKLKEGVSSLEDLKIDLGLLNNEYPIWADFYKKFLLKNAGEVNEMMDFYIEFHPAKSRGKKITHVQWKIFDKVEVLCLP